MIYVALPAMDEPDLPARLLDLNRQSLLPRTVCVCINQPRSYHVDGIPAHLRVCRANQKAYEQIRAWEAEGRFAFGLELIDRFSLPDAWDEKHFGVGWARKTAMDSMARAARNPESDILVCMDADTSYPADYLQDIQKQFDAYPTAAGLSNPYLHVDADTLPEEHQRAILHYETYMRAYALNMILCDHPYAFTAVGSSMACRVKAYLKIGGISPFKSGEDFYFLQKLVKTGSLIVHSPSVSRPSARLSGRVFFGTGPALQKGLGNRWESYPVYPPALFERMQRAYDALPGLFQGDRPSADLDFWQTAFGPGWWASIRRNSGGRQEQFVHACKEKFDALRSLQFLKAHYRQDDVSDWKNLSLLYRKLSESGLADPKMEALCRNDAVRSLCDLCLQDWKDIRRYLFSCERHLRQERPLLPAW